MKPKWRKSPCRTRLLRLSLSPELQSHVTSPPPQTPPITLLPSNINRGIASCPCRLSINPPERLSSSTCPKFSRSDQPSLTISFRLCEVKKKIYNNNNKRRSAENFFFLFFPDFFFLVFSPQLLLERIPLRRSALRGLTGCQSPGRVPVWI